MLLSVCSHALSTTSVLVVRHSRVQMAKVCLLSQTLPLIHGFADIDAVDGQNHKTTELSKQAHIEHIAQHVKAEADQKGCSVVKMPL